MSADRKLVLSVTAKDCRLDTFRSGGPGGQNQNKRDTGCRWTHEASGAVGESREERSQLQNKRTAFRRMVETPQFQVWLKKTLGHDDALNAEMERRVAQQVERDMATASRLWDAGADLASIARHFGVIL